MSTPRSDEAVAFYRKELDFEPIRCLLIDLELENSALKQLLLRAYNDGIECCDGKDICHSCPEKKRSICKDINAVLQPNSTIERP